MSEVPFDQGLKKLEEIVRKLEDSECSLEDALKLFEEGVKLTRLLNDKLDKAQAAVEVLRSSPEGFGVVPFEGEGKVAGDA